MCKYRSLIYRSLTGGFRGAVALAALTSLNTSPALGQVVYDNGSYIGGTNARGITAVASADDLDVVSSLTFNQIRFFAWDPALNLPTNFSGTLSWFIYANNVNKPSTTIIASGTTSDVTVTDTGDTHLGIKIKQMDFAIVSTTLDAGKYWVRVKEGTLNSPSDGSSLSWMQTGSPIKGFGFRGDAIEENPTWATSATNTTVDLAYQLLNVNAVTAAPEPGTLALLVLAALPLAAMVIRRRRHEAS